MAKLDGGPDDATVDTSGHLWVSERSSGRMVRLAASATLTVRDSDGPEGIVVLDDGDLLVAQQTANRIDRYDVTHGRFLPWLRLGPAPAQLGVDGIARPGKSLLVPDSHAGTLLRVPIEGSGAAGAPSVIARGLGRPVDAAQLSDGRYIVTEENPPGLVVVAPGGSVTPLAHDRSLDDVVVERGVAYVTDLAARSVDAIDVASGQQRMLVSGLGEPQGLALVNSGRSLLVSDERSGLVLSSPVCR